MSLASLAAPGTGIGGPQAAGTPNESGQQRVYTAAEIAAFYRDVRKVGTAAERPTRLAIERGSSSSHRSKAGYVRNKIFVIGVS